MHGVFRGSYRIFQYSDVLFQTLKNTCSSSFRQSVDKLLNKPNCVECVGVRSYCIAKSDNGSAEANSEDVDVEGICKGNEQLAHKLKVILLEMEVMRQEGKCVPLNSHLKAQHWEELLKLPSFSGRRKFLEFLFKTSKKKENDQKKKEEARIIREERLKERPKAETLEEFVTTYDLQHNNIFLRFYDTSINQMYNNRLIQAIQYGQKLVIDCGYDQKMTRRENQNCAKQMMLMFAENRFHQEPYDLHFCNANPDSCLISGLNNYIPTMYEPWFPMNIHQESYLEMFPKQKLIYLTPHCREELTEFDHDAVYIIGALVDKVNNEPLSMAKAKKENIKMVKFPLDRYLQWTSGSGKSLTLNQVVSIMLDVKQTGDWNYALRHVPRRKVVDVNDDSQSNSQTSSPMTNPQNNSQTSSSVRKWKKHTTLWKPRYNADFDDLHYKSNSSSGIQYNKIEYKKDNQHQKKRLNNVRTIMYDE